MGVDGGKRVIEECLLLMKRVSYKNLTR